MRSQILSVPGTLILLFTLLVSCNDNPSTLNSPPPVAPTTPAISLPSKPKTVVTTQTQTTTHYRYDSYGNRIGSSQSVVRTHTTYFTWEATSTTGSVLHYQWEKISGNGTIVSGANSSEMTFRQVDDDTAVLKLTVRDTAANTIDKTITW